MRAPSNCSSGSSRACHRVDTVLSRDGQDAARAVHEAIGNVGINLSIDDRAREPAGCAESFKAGSCEVPVPDTCGEATSTWKRRSVPNTIV